jgi:SPP1 gp7 family putative phage head morphogenesis protein
MDGADVRHAIGLEPADAVRYLQGKGAAVTGGWTQWLDGEHARAFTVANVAKLDVVTDIHASLVQALKEGKTLSQWRDGLIPTLQAKGWWRRDGTAQQLQDAGRVDAGTGVIAKGLTPQRLSTIYRTNMQSAYMSGRYQQMVAQASTRPFWQYVAVLDARTRPAHRALNGRVFRFDDKGWQSFYPPCGYNCFLPGTQVQGQITGALKAWYAGEAVEISTAKGNRLRVTINHPVLTSRGWITAGELREGDDLISNSGMLNAFVPVVVNNQEPPPFVEDVFESLACDVLRVVDVAPDDLHGDARFVNRQIHIAGSYAALANEGEASGTQALKQGPLFGANVVAGVEPLGTKGAALGHPILPQSIQLQNAPNIGVVATKHRSDLTTGKQGILIQRAHALFEFGVAVSRGLPGITELSSDEIRVLLDALPLDPLGFSSAPQLYAALLQKASDGLAAETLVFRELLETGPSEIALDQVVGIRRFNWSGHVYDFSTVSGLLFANGILVHNCRCRVRNLNARDLTRQGVEIESTDGHLQEVQVPLRDGTTATVTRYKGPSMGAKGFQPDPGFSNNPAQSTWMPRLGDRPTQLSDAFVRQVVAGPAFEQFVQARGALQGNFPVGVVAGRADTGVYLASEQLAAGVGRSVPLQRLQLLPDLVSVGRQADNGALQLAEADGLLEGRLDEVDGLLQVVALSWSPKAAP